MQYLDGCEFVKECWRYSYSAYLQDVGYIVPPDRIFLLCAGYAVQEMLPRGGVYCETMPCKEGGCCKNLCPLFVNKFSVASCFERKREIVRRSRETLRKERRDKFFDKTPRTFIPREVRREVARRDNYACVYCGVSCNAPYAKCAVDHVLPLARGGTNELSNLALSCRDCNAKKGTKILTRGVFFKQGAGEI